ncbi:MAG TPA: ATP-binding protein [Pseudoduganella sp.]
MSAPEPIAELIAGLTARVRPVDGECEKHGAATMLTREGLPWHCPACIELDKSHEFQKQAAAERHAHLHSIADIPSRYRGQRFISHCAEHKEVRAMVSAFRDFIVAEPRWAALILTGVPGTGKTQLACEFAESYINRLGRSVRYITAKSMIAEVQSSYNAEGKSERGEIERFVQYDLLILDEIDAISSKDNAALLLTEIVNRRYGENKPVIAITNQQLDPLRKFVGDRVHDRLMENSFICLFDWQSFRRAG